MAKEIYQKEFSVGRIIKESWKIYKTDFKTIFELVLAVGAGKFFMTIMVLLFAPLVSRSVSEDVVLKFAEGLDALIGIVLAMAVAWMVKMVIDGQAADFSESLAKGFSRWTTVIITDLFKSAILMWPLLLLVVYAVTKNILYLSFFMFLLIPAVIWSVYWFFSTYSVVFSGKSGMAALSYSKSVVKGRSGTVFGYAVILGILITAVGILAALLVVLAEKLTEGMGVYVSVPAAFLMKLFIEVINAYYYVALAVFFINFDATKTGGSKAASSENISTPKGDLTN